MSKAFTKESDEDLPARPVLPARPSLPAGVKNYFTRDGADRLNAELHQLLTEEKPRLLSLSQTPDTMSALTQLETRALLIQDILSTVVVVDPPPDQDRVRFGAYVTVREKDHPETTYRIVGLEEIDLDREWISWQSPLARALLNRGVGDSVSFKSPLGERLLTVVSIRYGA